MKYRPEIDGLRAVAVLPVILVHAGFKTLSGGYVGVDIFFVISGYLITSIILAEQQEGSFSIVNFYERRARRILPALFFVMLVSLPFAWAWLLPPDMKEFARSLVAVSLFVSNFLFWKASGYFDIAAELKPMLHTWSLAVEEQYYLLFPLLVVAVWRYGLRALVILLALLFAVSLGLAQWGSVAKPDAAYYLLLSRGWELLVGSFVALYLTYRQRERRQSELIGWLGMGLIAYSVLAFNNLTPFPGLYALAPTMGAALIILCAGPNTQVGKLLGSRIFVSIGLISYSAYLWHQPLLAFARHRAFEGLSEPWALAMVALTLVLAYVSWRFVEQPFRSKQQFSRRQIFSISAVGMALFIAMGTAGSVTEGFEQRFTFVSAHEGDVGQKDFYRLLDDTYPLCKPAEIANDPQNKVTFRCLQSKKGTDATVALIGDSHAEHLFLGLADALPHENVLMHGRGSYPSMNNPEFKKIFDYVLATPSVHSVLISTHWYLRAEQIPAGTSLEKELEQTADILLTHGKAVYFFGDVPRFPLSPERCKFVAVQLGHGICTAPIEFVHRYARLYEPALHAFLLAQPEVKSFALQDVFCTETRCSMLVENQLMFRDNHHLNIPGSRHVGQLIAEKFPELAKSTKPADTQTKR